jgi:transcriptional regulator with XRE-family HTH domain
MSGPKTRDQDFAWLFGLNLLRHREALGISQEELGFLAQLHRTAVGQLERGERTARTDTLVRLCGSLQVGPDALLAGLRWRPTRIDIGELEIEPAKASQPKEAKPETKEAREEEPPRNPEANQ